MTKPAAMIAVINRKGGVGKTTISHALAFTMRRAFLTGEAFKDTETRPIAAVNHLDMIDRSQPPYLLIGRGYTTYSNLDDWAAFIEDTIKNGKLTRLVGVLDTGANLHSAAKGFMASIDHYVVPLMIAFEDDMLAKTLDTISYIENDLGGAGKISVVLNAIPGDARSQSRLLERERAKHILGHEKIASLLLPNVLNSIGLGDITDKRIQPLTLDNVGTAVRAIYPMASALVERAGLPLRLQTEAEIRAMAHKGGRAVAKADAQKNAA